MTDELIGLVGTVSHAVRGGDRPGEIKVSENGIPYHLIAYCSRALPQGTQVLVVNNRGGRQVDVEPWTDPVPGSPGTG